MKTEIDRLRSQLQREHVSAPLQTVIITYDTLVWFGGPSSPMPGIDKAPRPFYASVFMHILGISLDQ